MNKTTDRGDTNVQVAVRIRPLLPREEQSQSGICMRRGGNTVEIRECGWEVQEDAELYPSYKFTFDRVFGEDAGQTDVYVGCAEDVVESFIEGFNSSIMAYGISSAGKTYTIRDNGIVLRAAKQIFAALSGTDKERFQLTVSYYQIYNESVLDLLNPSGLNLKVRETSQQEIYVEHLSHEPIYSVGDLEALMLKGDKNRVQAETKLNTNSSRSHAVLTFFLINQVRNTKSKLQILDLAGSERINSNQKERQAETKHINQSLAVLGTVMQQIVQFQKALRLAEQQDSMQIPNVHIGFRNSKLTRVLQDSIGGNCKLLLIVCVSPSALCFFETLNSLKFANRAKEIKQHATINEVENVSIEVEIEKLKCQIQETVQLIKEARASGGQRGDYHSMEYDGESDVEDDAETETVQRMEQQIQLYEQTLGDQSFQTLQNTYQQLQQLEQLKSDSQDQVNDINQLRMQSLGYRDFLIILTDKLQQKEESLQKLDEELKEVQSANQLLAARLTPLKPELSESGHSTNSAQQNNYWIRSEGIKMEINKEIQQMPQNQSAILDYTEKKEELLQLREQFGMDLKTLQKQYAELKISIQHQKQQLEERTRELISSQINNNQNSQISDLDVSTCVAECEQERKLLIEIFENKLLTKVKQIQNSGSGASIQALKSYVLQLLDAVLHGDLRAKLTTLFG